MTRLLIWVLSLSVNGGFAAFWASKLEDNAVTPVKDNGILTFFLVAHVICFVLTLAIGMLAYLNEKPSLSE